MKLWLLVCAVASLLVSCDRNGAVRGIFRLREDSALPSWVALSPDAVRDGVNVTITAYEATTTPKWKVKFQVRDKKTGRIIQEVIGSGYWHPDSEREKAPAGTYPNWVIIEVNGTKDIYEQSEA